MIYKIFVIVVVSLVLINCTSKSSVNSIEIEEDNISKVIEQISFNFNSCELNYPCLIENDTLIAIRDCDSIFFINNLNNKVLTYKLRNKSFIWRDTLVFSSNYFIYSDFNTVYVFDKKWNVIYTEELFKAVLEKAFNSAPSPTVIEQFSSSAPVKFSDNYKGITPFSGSDLRILINLAEENCIVFEYMYLIHHDLNSYSYFDTLKINSTYGTRANKVIQIRKDTILSEIFPSRTPEKFYHERGFTDEILLKQPNQNSCIDAFDYIDR